MSTLAAAAGYYLFGYLIVVLVVVGSSKQRLMPLITSLTPAHISWANRETSLRQSGGANIVRPGMFVISGQLDCVWLERQQFISKAGLSQSLFHGVFII